MASVTDQTRAAVWATLCDLEHHRRYYAALADRYRFLHRILRFSILAGVVVEGIVLYLATIHPWLFYLGIGFGAVLAILTIWDATSNYAEDAAVARLTAFACDDLKRECDELWRMVESGMVNTTEAEAANRSIVGRWAVATQRVQAGTHRRLNLQTAQEANQEMQYHYDAQIPIPSA